MKGRYNCVKTFLSFTLQILFKLLSGCSFSDGDRMITQLFERSVFLEKSLNLSKTKLLPSLEMTFFGSPYSANIILQLIVFHFLCYWELAVIVYNEKEITAINIEGVCSNLL